MLHIATDPALDEQAKIFYEFVDHATTWLRETFPQPTPITADLLQHLITTSLAEMDVVGNKMLAVTEVPESPGRIEHQLQLMLNALRLSAMMFGLQVMRVHMHPEVVVPRKSTPTVAEDAS